jgi:hypothetical protein
VAKPKVKPITGRAWCGAYSSGQLGWILPQYLDKNTSMSTLQEYVLSEAGRDFYPSDLYRVKIIIEPLYNKKGNLIVRRNKRG